MTKTIVRGALLGGLVAYLWGMASWMALPWHNQTMHAFEHDVDVARMLDFGAPSSGMYLTPQTALKDMKPGNPVAMVAYSKNGMRPMGQAIALGLGTQILGGFLLCWLLSKTSGLTYPGQVLFASCFGLAVGILGHAPDWVWWNFASDYTLVAIADSVIAWSLAGLVIGKVA